MRSREEIAAFYRIAINLRLVDPAAVTVWADGEILRMEKPDEAVIDLALADVMAVSRRDAALREIEGWPYQSPGAFHLLGALLWRRVHDGDMTMEEVAILVYATSPLGTEQVFGNIVYWIDECFGPYMDRTKGALTVLNFLQRFSGEELPPV